MTPQALLHSLVTLVWRMAECVFRPLTTITQLLGEFEQSRSLAPFTKIWLPALVLSMIIDYPLLNWFGIKWNNIGFYAPEELVVIASLLLTAVMIHVLLCMCEIPSDFYKTTLLYTIVVIYSPITTLMTIPLAYNQYNLIRSIKLQAEAGPIGSAPLEALKRLLKIDFWGAIDVRSVNLNVVVMYATGFLSLLSFAALAELIVQFYRGPRYRTYLAVGISLYLVTVGYRSIALPIHSFIAYSFIKAPLPH
jgi:hypothetical protein